MPKIDSSIPLFKYLSAEHARMMVDEGRIRISLLSFYRNLELGVAIGDDLEGRRGVSIRNRTKSKSTIRNFKAPGIHLTNVGIEGFTDVPAFVSDEIAPLLYIYCVSSKRSIEIRDAFKAQECVHIRNSHRFFEVVSHALYEQRIISPPEYDLLSCIYKEPYREFDAGLLNKHTIIKDSDFPVWQQKKPALAYQEEVRALWRPTSSNPAQYIDLHCPDLVGLTEIVRLQ